jgi:hypothetical protein
MPTILKHSAAEITAKHGRHPHVPERSGIGIAARAPEFSGATQRKTGPSRNNRVSSKIALIYHDVQDSASRIYIGIVIRVGPVGLQRLGGNRIVFCRPARQR